MKRWMAIAIVLLTARTTAADPFARRTIDLQIVRDARMPAGVLEQAQADVTEIFARSGLTVRWTENGPRFTIRIVAQVLGYASVASPVMGIAVRSPKECGVRVFFRQVQDFARAYHLPLSTALGYVISHEVGHLILGPAHSDTGIMQARWDQALARDASRGGLSFSDEQARRIRTFP